MNQILTSLPRAMWGLPIVTSEYVPETFDESYEVDYSRPLWRRLVHGRTIDLDVTDGGPAVFRQEGQIIMHPNTYQAMRGFRL